MKEQCSIVLALVFMLASGCTTTDLRYSLDYDSSRKEFIHLLREGFSHNSTRNMKEYRYAPGLSHNKTSCIYGVPPNIVAKEHIDKIFTLFREELHIYDKYFYVRALSHCPSDTSMYIQLHEGMNREAIWKEAYNVLSRNDITDEKRLKEFKKSVDPVGFVIGGPPDSILDKPVKNIWKNKIYFTSINQISKHVNNNKTMKTFLRMLITEELFQMFTAGKDLHKKKSKSILQGLWSPLTQRQHQKLVQHNTKTTKNFLNANPQGMCAYDLWFMILARGFNKPLWFLEDYEDRLYDKYEDVKSRSHKIINNPAYEGLFDSRCIRNDDGVSTAMPIPQPIDIDKLDLADEFRKSIPSQLKGNLNLVELEKHCEGCNPWKYIDYKNIKVDNPTIRTSKILVQKGYRAVYAYPDSGDFSITKIEKSSKANFKQDKKSITKAITHEYYRKMKLVDNKIHKNPDLKNHLKTLKGKDYFTLEKSIINGYKYVSLTENIARLTSNTVSQVHIFVPEKSVIITAYFLWSPKSNKKYKNIEEFLQLKNSFIDSYTNFLRTHQNDR